MRRITLLLVGLMTIAPVFSQTTRSKGSSQLKGGISEKGANWETFTVVENGVEKTYDYFLGSESVDGLTTEKLLGQHWKGRDYKTVLGDTVYFVNVATGEYMQIGDFWGENSVTSHVGIPYKIISGTSTRKAGVLSDMGKDTYWLQPLDVREARVIGRSDVYNGKRYTFENTGYLYLRTQREYFGDNSGPGTHPGGLLFKFEPHTTTDGELAYVIYTHRKTYSGAMEVQSEHFNLDSYYLLTSIDGTDVADFNNVRLKKFAGEMNEKTPALVIVSDGTDNIANNDATAQATNNHKYGTYSSANGGNTFTSNSVSGLEGVTLTANGNYLKARYFSYGHVLQYVPPTDEADKYTLTITAPEGYVISKFYLNCRAQSGGRQFSIKSPNNERHNIYAGFGRGEIDEVVDDKKSVTLKIGIDFHGAEGTGDFTLGLDIKELRVTLKPDPASNTTIPFTTGVNTAKGDSKNLWKIVTKRQRDGYRVVASEKKPVDVSGRIFNPKYNTSYVYNMLVGQCNPVGDPVTHYVPKDGNAHPDYGWDWYERNQETHPIVRHVHPWNLQEGVGNYSIDKEFHKVGTGRFWRFSERNDADNGFVGGRDANMQEAYTTYGTDANYCGSIYKGTANLQQTITGLKAGLYYVFVRGFFAPHNMEKYKRENSTTLKFDGSEMDEADEDWIKEALITDAEGNVKKEDGQPVWRRSHDSYLFAWSSPGEIGSPKREVRRMLPSVYEGSTPVDQIGTMSKDAFVADGGGYEYTSLNGQGNAAKNLVRDDHVFAFYKGSFFGLSDDNIYAVPRIVSGAGRFFEAFGHPTANNYRIGLPVTVGRDGKLTIGVDHTHATSNVTYKNPDTGDEQTVKSGDNEWVCFDEWELIYLGADEPDDFVVDELNGQKTVGGYKYINGYTGKPFTSTDTSTPEQEEAKEVFRDYYDESGNALTSPEVTCQNNTQYLDIFEYAADFNEEHNDGKGNKTIKNVIIRRTMTTNGWNSIVLPVPLSKAKFEEAFGKGTLVSKLKGVSGKILMYESVDTIMPGQPYIIKPTEEPQFKAGEYFERRAFSDAVSNTELGVAGYFFKGNHYLRNYEVEDSIEGPVYVAQDVDIYARDVFPHYNQKTLADSDYDTAAKWQTNRQVGAVQWYTPREFSQGVKVLGYSQNFTLKEFAFYENPGNVPANSYYHNKGMTRYTATGFTTTKGMLSYLQLIDQSTSQPMAKSFLESGFYFEPIEDPVVTGIEDVNNRPEVDGKIEIYDLQGRKVLNPRPGTIYIMNGVKVMWQ